MPSSKPRLNLFLDPELLSYLDSLPGTYNAHKVEEMIREHMRKHGKKKGLQLVPEEELNVKGFITFLERNGSEIPDRLYGIASDVLELLRRYAHSKGKAKNVGKRSVRKGSLK